MTMSTHDEYFASVSPDVRARLEEIQRVVEEQVPGAIRCFGYGVPAFKQRRVFFYFAALKAHIGIYPPLTLDTALIEELGPYRNKKGNLAFPLKKPLPLDLIGRLAVALSQQYGGG